MPKLFRIAFVTLLGLAALTGLARQVLYVKTQHAGFERQPPGKEWPTDRGMRFDSLKIASAGRTLDAWWIPAAGVDSGAVLLFHGNAENIADWLDAASLLHSHHLDVMLFD